MRPLMVLIRLLPSLAKAVRSGEQARIDAVHDRADELLGRTSPLPEAPPALLFAMLADVRAITCGARGDTGVISPAPTPGAFR